ncbi:conserved Plasmodium protein, unknown function [Plasmodium ovale wallikeri]|uniref:Ataxin-2 like protein n=1 Tax=Plasmodium ovale wallikeri TaxID=864142 RepID=A0A1A8ZM19_PLAOA|nr:conserved Plasmodium protein, unknown function [Plasmodium ovale wallikeri]SBT45258.1 conserved Plasmodium protein, unknown function [Plasmodium ovale wallikeri]
MYPPIKDRAQLKPHTELCPFPVVSSCLTFKATKPNRSFDALMKNVLKRSKEEDIMNSPLEFKTTQQFSYKNILGELPPCPPVNKCQEPNSCSNNVPVQQNISNILVNIPFIPVMSRTVNGHFLDNPPYLNPYIRSYYPNNCTPVNMSNGPFFNMPMTNMDANFPSNKNMHMYQLRNPNIQNAHVNFPVPSYISANMNYGINNNNSMNMMNNSNSPNPNINMPPYPPEYIFMNSQKFANAHSVPIPFFPQYQYQNYYAPPAHGMNNA